MSWFSLIKLQVPRTATLLKGNSNTSIFFCEICKIFANASFYRKPPVAASYSFRVTVCNFLKKMTPKKMFSCELCKIFKNIFSFYRTPPNDCFLCLSVSFEKVFQNTAFIQHFWETAYFMYQLQNFNHQIQ